MNPRRFPFWRSEPLTAGERALFEAFCDAHHQSVFRNNYSSVAAINTAKSSGNFAQALAAAVLTVGAEHAPVLQTFDLLTAEHPALNANALLTLGRRVPGWGSSFTDGKSDPIWTGVEDVIRTMRPDLGKVLDSISSVLAHKKLLPNPSAFTACVAIILGMPRQAAPWLFFTGRLNGWASLVSSNLK